MVLSDVGKLAVDAKVFGCVLFGGGAPNVGACAVGGGVSSANPGDAEADKATA
jgi:hypothetical protein